MFIFTNDKGQTLVTKTNLYVRSSFSLPELDTQLEALVIATTLSPKPAINIQGTVGGTNLLNVFGEDPMEIQLTGIVVGPGCDSLNRAKNALGIAMQMFVDHGVVNRVTPLRYQITGQQARNAFMVGLQVSQDNTFSDYANFSMMLLAESLQKKKPSLQVNAVPPVGPSPVAAIPNTGVVARSITPISSRSYATALASSSLLPSGDVESPQAVGLEVSGFNSTSQGFDA